MSRRILFLGFLLASLVSASAAPPVWWASRGATDANPPNDDAAVNQGQLKQFTQKAVQELNARIPGGAGAELNSLINGWGQVYQTGGHNAANPLPTDFEAMNSGQLKWIANKVHARLVFAKYEDAVPAWLVENPATDIQLVNLGQLKTVFNFDLNSPDGELPLWWQKFYFNGQTGIDPNGDPDSDSSTNLQEFQNGTNPQVPNIPVPNIPVDSDSDGLPDAEDADPNDSVVDWAPAAEASYAVIEMEQVNFAGYPFPAQLNPLNYWTHTRASIGKGGTVLWQYPVKSTNAAEDEWNDRYRVWKNGAWSADITNQSTEFTSFSMSTSYASTIDTWNPSITTQVNVTVDCVASIPHAVCGDLILGLGDYGGSQDRLPVCYTDSDANPPTAETRNDGYASTGAVHVATLWTLGAESVTADPIDPPSSYKFMSLYYFGSSAPLMGIMNYRPVASPGGALAILGTQTTAGVGLWKIWNAPDNVGSQVPGQGSSTVINAGAWPHDDLLLIRAIEDGGVAVGERYSVGVGGGLRHQVVNDHGSESELPGSEGITHSALAICRVPTGVSGQSRLVAAGTDLWVQKNGQWSTAAYKPSANTILAVSKNGVLLGTQAIWRNGKEISLDSLVANQKVSGPGSSARYTNLLGYAMNGEGAIVALADDALHPGSGKKTLLTLIPVDFKTYPVSESGPDKAHKLNLDTRQNEKASYGQGWEKCVSKVWATANTVNLIDYLDGGPGNHSVYENAVKWKVNGTAQTSHELSLGNEPSDDSHRHYYIEVQSKSGGDTIDRLIITLVPRSTKSRFDSWYTTEKADLVWLGELVNLFYSISTVPLPDGYMRRPCRNFNPFLYAVPSATNTRMHPDAYYETRSYATPGGHAHQMCFDDSGILLQSGVSAGSADKAAAFLQNLNPYLHVDADVKPFVWALQLDGTPADQQTTTLSAPIMHEGAYLKKYSECRPAIANSKPILADGATP